MPRKGTEDWVEELVERYSDEVTSPDEIASIVDYFTRPAKTSEGKERIREVIEEHVLPRILEERLEDLRYHWRNEEEHPEYYRSKAEEYLRYVFEHYDERPTLGEVAEALGISESYAKYLRWLIRRADIEV